MEPVLISLLILALLGLLGILLRQRQLTQRLQQRIHYLAEDIAIITNVNPSHRARLRKDALFPMAQALNRLANGGAMQLDPNRTLTFARDRTEAANGRDDDGDGLVDEGSIELTNTDGSRSVVVSGVESISYSIAGRVLTLAIQVGARDSARRVHRSRHQLSISLRNN